MKKIIALLLSFVMLLSLCLPTFAEEVSTKDCDVNVAIDPAPCDKNHDEASNYIAYVITEDFLKEETNLERLSKGIYWDFIEIKILTRYKGIKVDNFNFDEDLGQYVASIGNGKTSVDVSRAYLFVIYETNYNVYVRALENLSSDCYSFDSKITDKSCEWVEPLDKEIELGILNDVHSVRSFLSKYDNGHMFSRGVFNEAGQLLIAYENYFEDGEKSCYFNAGLYDEYGRQKILRMPKMVYEYIYEDNGNYFINAYTADENIEYTQKGYFYIIPNEDGSYDKVYYYTLIDGEAVLLQYHEYSKNRNVYYEFDGEIKRVLQTEDFTYDEDGNEIKYVLKYLKEDKSELYTFEIKESMYLDGKLLSTQMDIYGEEDQENPKEQTIDIYSYVSDDVYYLFQKINELENGIVKKATSATEYHLEREHFTGYSREYTIVDENDEETAGFKYNLDFEGITVGDGEMFPAEFATVTDALKAHHGYESAYNPTVINLVSNICDEIVIPEDRYIVLNFNGFEIKAEGVGITNYGTLVILDDVGFGGIATDDDIVIWNKGGNVQINDIIVMRSSKGVAIQNDSQNTIFLDLDYVKGDCEADPTNLKPYVVKSGNFTDNMNEYALPDTAYDPVEYEDSLYRYIYMEDFFQAKLEFVEELKAMEDHGDVIKNTIRDVFNTRYNYDLTLEENVRELRMILRGMKSKLLKAYEEELKADSQLLQEEVNKEISSGNAFEITMILADFLGRSISNIIQNVCKAVFSFVVSIF